MPERRSILLTTLIRAYLDDLRVRNYSRKTIRAYEKVLQLFTNWGATAGVTALQDFTAEAVKRYIVSLQNRTRFAISQGNYAPQPPLSPVAIRNYVRDLKSFASWLAQEHYTSSNVLAEVRKPKADETPVEPYSDAEIERIFAALDPTDPFGLRDYALFHTLWDTGLRVGELVALRLKDVNFHTCEIRVTHAKFGKWRDVGFGKQTHKFLTRYLAIGRPEPMVPEDEHLFLSLDGYPMTEATVQRICYRISKRTGVHVHCHRFRHTFAVNMLRAGVDIRTLQKLMGHASIQILTRYLNLANIEVLEAHRSNSPADRFHAQKMVGGRRLPIRRNQIREA